MANTRVAQMGQVAVDQPFYEVVYNGKRYAFAVNKRGRIEFVTPSFLKSLGVYSHVADMFQSVADADIKTSLSLDFANSTAFDRSRFQYVSLGTGFGFNSNFLAYKGWTSLSPVNAQVI